MTFKKNESTLDVPKTSELETLQDQPSIDESEKDSDSKKYVIYIDSDNINYMENLSVNERKQIINKILKEQNELDIKTRELNARKRFLKHALLACFTFIIGLPIMFIAVNKAVEITIDNYQFAKANFMKLYKEKGKIKMEESGYIKNVKY